MATAVGNKKEFTLKWKGGTLVLKIYNGSITKPSGNVEAIVSVWDRDKAGGISEAVIKEAGNEVAEEIKANRQIKLTENLVTLAGRLPCKFIIHCACPRWEHYDTGSKTQCLKDLCGTVKKVLKTACDKGVKSVALPPIGTGKKFGIPKIASAEMYVKAILEFRKFLPGINNPIKEIHFIDKKDDMIEWVTDAYKIACVNPSYLEEKSVIMRLNDLVKSHGEAKYPRNYSSTCSSHFEQGRQHFSNPYSPYPIPASPQPKFTQPQYPLQSNLHTPRIPQLQYPPQSNLQRIPQFQYPPQSNHHTPRIPQLQYPPQSNLHTPRIPQLQYPPHSIVHTPRISNVKHISSSVETEIFEMNGLPVLIYTEDLTNVNNVDILVSTENTQVPGNGRLAKAILDRAGKPYQKEHAKLFSVKKKHNTAEVLQTGAGCLSFKIVLHAIIDKFPDAIPSDFHLQQLWSTTLNILNKAFNKNIRKKKMLSIALPLLGTGSIQNPQHLAKYANVMLQGIESFSSATNVNLKTVHIVNFTEQTTKVVVDVLKSFCTHSCHQKDPHVKKQAKSEIMKNSGKDSHKFNPKKYRKIDSWSSSENHKQNVDLFLVSVPPKNVCEDYNSSPVQNHGSKSCTGNLLMIDSDSDDSETEISESSDCKLSEKGACAAVVDENETLCVICMDDVLTDPVQLKNCKHEFCRECITEYLYHKSACPVCNTVYGEMYGNQPENGTAEIYVDDVSLPGYSCKTLIIHYEFPNGNQTENHPSPGESYHGLSRHGYLPDNKEGRLVLKMLKRAFEHRLIFTVGFSRTSGKDNVVTWNDIHHKTRREGGPEKYGYPDPEYLSRVKEELNAKGISEE